MIYLEIEFWHSVYDNPWQSIPLKHYDKGFSRNFII